LGSSRFSDPAIRCIQATPFNPNSPGIPEAGGLLAIIVSSIPSSHFGHKALPSFSESGPHPTSWFGRKRQAG
jgi:hypothetical protein